MRHPSLMTETSLLNNRSLASDVILWMFIFIVALIIFNVPLGEVFVPFSAILVAVSFAIGTTVPKPTGVTVGGSGAEAF